MSSFDQNDGWMRCSSCDPSRSDPIVHHWAGQPFVSWFVCDSSKTGDLSRIANLINIRYELMPAINHFIALLSIANLQQKTIKSETISESTVDFVVQSKLLSFDDHFIVSQIFLGFGKYREFRDLVRQNSNTSLSKFLIEISIHALIQNPCDWKCNAFNFIANRQKDWIHWIRWIRAFAFALPSPLPSLLSTESVLNHSLR